jgi:hypothetical protein
MTTTTVAHHFSGSFAYVVARVAENENLDALEDLLRDMTVDNNGLSANICAALLEYVIAAIEYAPNPAPARTADRVSPADLRAAAAALPAPANGFYTVTLPDGGAHVTIRIADDFRAGSAAKIAGYLAGPDNESDYVNFAFVEGGQVRAWSRFKGGYQRQANAAAVIAGTPDRADLALAYAQASGRCARCGRTLTVPASLHRGFGPDCAAKLGI